MGMFLWTGTKYTVNHVKTKPLNKMFQGDEAYPKQCPPLAFFAKNVKMGAKTFLKIKGEIDANDKISRNL